jgi:hypothetical protein
VEPPVPPPVKRELEMSFELHAGVAAAKTADTSKPEAPRRRWLMVRYRDLSEE